MSPDPDLVPYATVALDAIPAQPGEPFWRPIRHHLGVKSFGVNGWVASAVGDQVIEDHVEADGDDPSDHEELYLVIRGRATFTVDGDEIDAPAGTLVYVPDPRSRRGATAREADTAVLALGNVPGRAYELSPWERREFPEDA